MDSGLFWSLVCVQIALGTFDMLFHHEVTERLAWRGSQRLELRLHAVRNLLYAFLFIVFGWLEPRGVYAAVVLIVLAVEVPVTL